MKSKNSENLVANLKLATIVFLVTEIKKNPGITGTEISNKHNIRNLYLILKKLEDKTIILSESQGKKKKLYITSKGLEILKQLKKII